MQWLKLAWVAGPGDHRIVLPPKPTGPPGRVAKGGGTISWILRPRRSGVKCSTRGSERIRALIWSSVTGLVSTCMMK